MRIIGGAWRGRRLVAPAGIITRPTAERLRQALFDMMLHAPWGGSAVLANGCLVLDLFAGTGALGLEALSRGAARAEFMETDPAALRALKGNIMACGADAVSQVCSSDAARPPFGPVAQLVFLDPPYGRGFADLAMAGLIAAGRLTAASLVVAELGPGDEAPRGHQTVAERAHGKGWVWVGRRS